MNYRQLQDILTQDIDLLVELRGRLNNDGEPLSTADKQILRKQLSGNWLKDMQMEQKYAFAQGNARDMGKGIDIIFEVMEQLQ